MARTNNLTNFLTDVATAIKAKLGDDTSIPAAQFDSKIMDIETPGSYQSKNITITTNSTQTVSPDVGYDALSSVSITVAVPETQLQTKTYTFRQNVQITVSPDSGYDGFSTVTLDINVPTSSGAIGYTSVADMEASSPATDDYAYVYNTKMDGLFQYKEVDDAVPSPYRTSITYSNDSTPATIYTPSVLDNYMDLTKVLTILTALCTDYDIKLPVFNAKLVTLPIAYNNNKFYVMLTKGTVDTDIRYVPVINAVYNNSIQGNIIYSTNTLVDMSDVRFVLWELDFDNVTYKQPTEVSAILGGTRVYYTNVLNINNAVVNVNTTNGTATTLTSIYNINTTSIKAVTSTSFTPQDRRGWELKPNSVYIDTSDGNIVSGDVLLNKVAYSNNSRIVGTMPNNGSLDINPTTSQQAIPAGYTSGGNVRAVTSAIDNNIQPTNIRKDITILGITGTYEPTGGDATSDANLQAKYLLTGYSAVVDGQLIAGTMPERGTATITPTGVDVTIPEGHYNSLTIPIIQASSHQDYAMCNNAILAI